MVGCSGTPLPKNFGIKPDTRLAIVNAPADTTVGSTCSLTTTANTLVPGAVTETTRTIWQVGQIQVQDGGEGGDGSTEGDNTVYLKQGIFVP